MDTDQATSLKEFEDIVVSINAEITRLQGLVAAEDDKMLRYKVWALALIRLIVTFRHSVLPACTQNCRHDFRGNVRLLRRQHSEFFAFFNIWDSFVETKKLIMGEGGGHSRKKCPSSVLVEKETQLG